MFTIVYLFIINIDWFSLGYFFLILSLYFSSPKLKSWLRHWIYIFIYIFITNPNQIQVTKKKKNQTHQPKPSATNKPLWTPSIPTSHIITEFDPTTVSELWTNPQIITNPIQFLKIEKMKKHKSRGRKTKLFAPERNW